MPLGLTEALLAGSSDLAVTAVSGAWGWRVQMDFPQMAPRMTEPVLLCSLRTVPSM